MTKWCAMPTRTVSSGSPSVRTPGSASTSASKPSQDCTNCAYKGEEACISKFRHTFRDKAALIVLDDVWHAADIEPFRAESPRPRLLVTTRDTGIAPTFGAREFTAVLPTSDEAREVLARWTGLQADALPAQASELIRECRTCRWRWP
jgi:NB-ARC domain